MATAWRNLSVIQKQSWNQLVPEGQSPFNHFVQCMANRYASNDITVPVFVMPSSYFVLSTLSVVALVSTQTITFTSTGIAAGNYRTHFLLSHQQSAGSSKNKRGMSICDYLTQSASFNRGFTTAYTSKYGALIAGKKIFYELKAFDQASGYQIFSYKGFFIVSP
jgi:hypothetical protein